MSFTTLIDDVQQVLTTMKLLLCEVYEAGIGYLQVVITLEHQLVQLFLGWLATG